MEDSEDERQHQQPSTPFWLQNTAFQSSSNRRRASFSSIIFSTTSMILLLLIAAVLIFIFFLVPSILNFTSQIFRPNSVKRSWDSLNLVLILFAIICAFLGRTNNNNENLNTNPASNRFNSPSPSYKYREREQQGNGEYLDRMTTTRMRSSSSYPDLRQQEDHMASPISPWVSADYIHRSNRVSNTTYRFSDDTQLRSYQFSDSNWQINTETQPVMTGRSIKTEDTLVVENQNPVEATPQPHRLPSPPPQLPFNPLPELHTRVKPKSTRTFIAVESAQEPVKPTPPPPSITRQTATTARRKSKRTNRSFDAFEFLQEAPPPHTSEPELTEKKKPKDFLSSFYTNQKRKKKRESQRSSENFDHILLKRPLVPSTSASTSSPPVKTTPLPPPPQPPPSVFKNLFTSKKSKSKKSSSESIKSKSYTKIAITQPPIQTTTTKTTSYNNMAQQRNLNRGNESPMYGIPEPPPVPPFGMPVWKFVVEGDYVRLKSMNSSRSGSPEPEEDRDDGIGGSSVNAESGRSEGGESESAAETMSFCPSPDVNLKADNFIAKFRAGLKMEKVNSGKGVGLSRLGPIADTNEHE